MILSDHSIKQAIAMGIIGIDPFEPENVQPSSVDVRMDDCFQVFDVGRGRLVVDPHNDNVGLTNLHQVKEEFVLHPGEFVLGSTVERITLADNVVARLEGKSSLGRLGLIIHSTAGFIDAGWDGQVTLELSNISRLPIRLYVGMKIGQVSFMEMSTPADRPYGSEGLGSKYQGQVGPVASMYHRNFEEQP